MVGADDDEPALAAAGPPAMTRRMVEIWRSSAELRDRYNISTPSGRLAFLRWLTEQSGRADFAQVADNAAAIVRRGVSLSRPAPVWEPQSCQTMQRREHLDAWLSEAIEVTFDDGLVIPVARCLALLWELRQDVRMHFRNGTAEALGSFLAWCLTQGIIEGCVAIDLVSPALAAFLDAESHVSASSGQLPRTRLLDLMAPLYGGPFPAKARLYPQTNAARMAVALWVCGAMRHRYGWPEDFTRHPMRWFDEPAFEFEDAFAPINNLLYALWQLDPNLRRHDINRHEGRAALHAWFDPQSGRVIPVDMASNGERNDAASVPLISPAAHAPGELLLVGYAGLVSGRAEDLRMSAAALRCQGKDAAVLDRMSGALIRDSASLAEHSRRPTAINIVHLNADTAFFDYLFLRAHGVSDAYTIGYWAWELAQFPDEWRCAFSFVDEVWTASRFSFDAIQAVASKPVFLMPLAVETPTPNPNLRREDFGLPPDDFIVYAGCDFRSFVARKNPIGAIAAFRSAFPRQAKGATLVIKTIGANSWRGNDRDPVVAAIGGDPRIRLIDEELERADTTALMGLCDCVLSLHRAEGFGRGPAEAMLLGKPVVVTNYSGTRDFASPDTAMLIDYELLPVGEFEYPGAAGHFWAEPDVEQAATALHRLANDPALRYRLGAAGRAQVQRLCDPATVGARYLARLDAIVK